MNKDLLTSGAVMKKKENMDIHVKTEAVPSIHTETGKIDFKNIGSSFTMDGNVDK